MLFHDDFLDEIELDMLQWKIARSLAEDIVRDMGYTEKDDDFLFLVEDEANRQWEEEMDRQAFKRNMDEYRDAEMSLQGDPSHVTIST